jgi:2-oxoglutarate ferredoxin oxidoreductase subunit beta
LPQLGCDPANTVFVSGIGCSSRFPYYIESYGFHTIHGRAPAFATGIKLANPALDVWLVTGDGDGLSIGGNHLIHALRRNVNFKILLFNNRIYGLTKGQYSPTSEVGKVTKSTPFGSIDPPFNPLSVALGAEASFVARTHDLDRQHMMDVLRAAHVEEPTNWSRRYKANLEKLHSGDVMKVAEVVRDLWRRERDRGLSAGEKRMLAKARQILVSELALAEHTNEDKAEAILDEVLAS